MGRTGCDLLFHCTVKVVVLLLVGGTVVITSNARVVRASRVYTCVSHACKCKLVLRL